MIGIVFFFDYFDIQKGIAVLDDVLSKRVFNARNFGATHLIMVDLTPEHLSQFFQHTDSQIVLERHYSLASVKSAHPGVNYVYLENLATFSRHSLEPTSLVNFSHPEEDVIYIGGPDTGAIDILSNVGEGENANFVNVPYVTNSYNEPVMLVALYDRMSKV